MIFEFMVILVALPRITGDCPPQCDCKWKSGKESAICINGNLTKIPTQLEGGTQLLDLTGNAMTTIPKDAFKAAGLVNLQKIYVAKCRIRSLDRYAFRKLINLVELDLSYNVITTVPSHIFDSISELRELKLGGNPIQKVHNDAFINVPQLVKLELTNCRISTVEPRAFSGLEHSLEWLKLDQNRLTDVKATTLTSLSNLHGLELAGNPWNCTCALKTLRQWMLSLNIPSSVPPACKTPPRLIGKTWDKLYIDEFACSPSISPEEIQVQIGEGSNVTMSCQVSGNPQPSVKWLWRNRPVVNVTSRSVPNHKKMYLLQYKDFRSSLTIHSVEPADAGMYLCVATNKAGKAQGNVTLSVTRQRPDPKISSKVILAGIVVALLLLVVSCLLICLFGTPRKETRNCPTENYEKIEMDKKGECYSDKVNKIHPKMGEYRGIPSGEEADVEDEAPSPESNLSEPRLVPTPSLRETNSKCLFPEFSGVQQHILRKEVLPSGNLYTTAPVEERNYPDLVAPPPSTGVIHFSGATLPRSKNWYPRVSSSQSPLLESSRCGSSAGESSGSNRRFSIESKSSSYYRLTSRGCERSASFLNLCEPEMTYALPKSKQWHHPSLPTSPVRHGRTQLSETMGPTETPILNLIGSAVYDYHAAQLERFLEEYRSLQDQLNRMKETCEGLREPNTEMNADAYCYNPNSVLHDVYQN